MFSIPAHIRLELGLPKLRARGRRGGQAAIWMAVPKAAVDQHHSLPPGKNDVRPAGQVAITRPMDGEAQTETMQKFSDGLLRLGVSLPHPHHQRTASRRGERVRERSRC